MRSVTPMKAAKTGYIIMSAIAMILGCVMIAAPETFASSMCVVLGMTSAVFGVVKLISYFSKDLFRLAFQHDLAEGILLIVLGITTAVKPELVMSVIGVIFGVCVFADGLLKIQVAIDAKAFGLRKWWLITAAAVLACTAGFFLIIEPLSGAAALAVIFGLSLIAEGALNLITVLAAVKIVKNQMPDGNDHITINTVQYR